MATLAATRITSVYADQPMPFAGYHEEFWQVASGGAAGDTVVLAPARGRFVAIASGGPTFNNINPTTPQTNVTLTLANGTTTIGSFQVRLLIQE